MKQSAAVFQGSSGALTPTVTRCSASCSGLHLVLRCICRAHALCKHWSSWCEFPPAQPQSSFLLSLTVVSADSHRSGCIRADVFHSSVLKNTKLWLYITCVHTNSTRTLLFAFKSSHGKLSPSPDTPRPNTHTQSHDCWRHLSNYRMERRAAEAKLFPSVAYSVTHGQAPVLIKSYSDTGASSPLFICLLRTVSTLLDPTAVTRHSCLSSAFPSNTE